MGALSKIGLPGGMAIAGALLAFVSPDGPEGTGRNVPGPWTTETMLEAVLLSAVFYGMLGTGLSAVLAAAPR